MTGRSDETAGGVPDWLVAMVEDVVRCGRALGEVFTGPRAGAERGGPAQTSILDDLAVVWLPSASGMHGEDLAGLLAGVLPRYRGWDAQQVNAAAKAAGVPVRQVKFRGRNRQGLNRADLDAALAARDSTSKASSGGPGGGVPVTGEAAEACARAELVAALRSAWEAYERVPVTLPEMLGAALADLAAEVGGVDVLVRCRRTGWPAVCAARLAAWGEGR